MPGTVILRPAHEGDCELVFAWANDAQTRAMSFASAAIPHADHLSWFAESLRSDSKRLFMAEDASGPLGLVRFGIHGQDRDLGEIGINLAPARRGQGLSFAVLQSASQQAKQLGLRRLIARIRPENRASQRAFLSAGYVARGEEAVGSSTGLRYELELQVRETPR